MTRRLALPLALAALALAPAAALAAAPWSTPAAVPGAAQISAPITVTPAGSAVTVAATSRDAPGSIGPPSEIAPVGPDGVVGTPAPVAVAAALVTSYAQTRIAVVGSTLVDGTITDRSHVAVALGSGAALGAARGLSGSTGQRAFAIAGNRRGDVAVLTGDASHRRTLYLRRAGTTTFRVALRISVGNRARGATVALGPTGRVLVVWEDAHRIYARHLGATGNAGPIHRIGDGVQSQLQAAIDDRGRLEVAWETQRVNEGESNTPAIVRFVTAAPGRGFGPQRTIETVGGAVGTGRYVSAPGVRLLAGSGGSALLAWTGFADGHFAVRAMDLANGHLGAVRTLTPAGIDAVLGDAGIGPRATATVVWRAGVQGADPIGPDQPVFASHRDAEGTAFGPPEPVSAAGEDVATAPSVAVDPGSGRSYVAYAPSTGLRVSVRP